MDSEPGKHYDLMGEAYIKKSENSLHNAYYERPAVRALLEEVNNKQVLEIGCAGGSITEWLVSQGAKVTAIDISKKMTNYTKERVGLKAKVITADVSKSLDFIESESIDLIIASLVLHYINNWFPVFKELQRVLKVDGEIVISTHHPHADWKWHDRPNYFRKELYEDVWTIDEKPYTVKYYHRTLADMFDVFRKFGFYVDVLHEPFPIIEAKDINPESYNRLITKPHFLFLRLKKRERGVSIKL
jgi:SAM-dependent methyltransferase